MTRQIIELDGRLLTSITKLHDVLSEVLELPNYYGRNLDALWDCLTESQSLPLTIRWTHYEASKRQLGNYCDELQQLFEDAKVELDDFYFEISS
ncbi:MULTISPECIES: barstar family protein [Paenibacillus]|uniref:Barstar family protein n=1 Tax=Paenibacillus alvei TaxID=44250 RepID=A0ABT4E852_PAEAL|nr:MULTISPECIES: barstar family protein [Paenibacillus]EPY13126.1 YrdF [Paenibacillus alvei A6-6i-x]MCY9529914.1 barstar family protein [Paenibacillus alvei]SDE78072.1 ribonuclease inhibitor [Paenibacillus sp. cl6col]